MLFKHDRMNGGKGGHPDRDHDNADPSSSTDLHVLLASFPAVSAHKLVKAPKKTNCVPLTNRAYFVYPLA